MTDFLSRITCDRRFPHDVAWEYWEFLGAQTLWTLALAACCGTVFRCCQRTIASIRIQGLQAAFATYERPLN